MKATMARPYPTSDTSVKPACLCVALIGPRCQREPSSNGLETYVRIAETAYVLVVWRVTPNKDFIKIIL